MNFKTIVSHKPADFPTFNAESFQTLPHQRWFQRFCEDHRCHDLAAHHWKCEVAVRGTLLVTPFGQLGMVFLAAPPAVKLWPVAAKHVGPNIFYELLPPGPLTPMTVSILDFKEWYAQPWEVASPICIIEANRGRNMLPMPSYFGKRSAPALPVLEHAANNGFGGMKLAFVKKVGKHECGLKSDDLEEGGTSVSIEDGSARPTLETTT